MNRVCHSRRDFLTKSTLCSGMILSGTLESQAYPDPDRKNELNPAKRRRISSIGGISLQQLRADYRSELFERFLPNMEKWVIDHDLGGFMCDLDIENGVRLSSNKRAWFEGRGIWLYSFLYNNFGQDSRFLEIAKKSKDFILKHQPTGEGFWVSSFTREGKDLSGPGDIFGDLYIAEGLAEYAKASGEEEYFSLAKKVLFNCVSQYDSAGYLYASEKTPAPRVLNHWMIILRNSTQMLEQKHDDEIDDLAKRCVKAIMGHHLNPEYNLLNITLSHNLGRILQGKYSQETSFGLGVQSLWMVMFEALRKKDTQLFDEAKALFKRHVEVARDTVYGGYFWSMDHVNDQVFRLGKTLSIHDEVLIGALFLIEHTNDTWAEECFTATYQYINGKFINPRYAFAIESGDRKMLEHNRKGVGIYHHPRQLMLNLLAFERIIERKGKTSGVLAG